MSGSVETESSRGAARRQPERRERPDLAGEAVSADPVGEAIAATDQPKGVIAASVGIPLANGQEAVMRIPLPFTAEDFAKVVRTLDEVLRNQPPPNAARARLILPS